MFINASSDVLAPFQDAEGQVLVGFDCNVEVVELVGGEGEVLSWGEVGVMPS